MGHGERYYYDYCIDDATLQTIGKKGAKKIKKDVVCKNVCACPGKTARAGSIDPFELPYLTHPEGRIKEKINESKYNVNMQEDSNTLPKHRNLFKHYKRKAKCSEVEPELMHYMQKGDIDDWHGPEIIERGTYLNGSALCTCVQDNLDNRSKVSSHKKYSNLKKCKQPIPLKCSCLGKIIYTDTKAQTERLPKKINKGTGILKNKKSTQILKKVEQSEYRKPKIKFASKAKYNGDDLYIGNILDCVCPLKENKIIELNTSENKKNAKFRKTIWPGKHKRNDKFHCACAQSNEPNEIQKISEVMQNKSYGNEKWSETAKDALYSRCPVKEKSPCKVTPKLNKKLKCVCSPKENKEHNVCPKGICAEAANKNQTDFVCNCEEKPTECTDVTCGNTRINNVTQSKSLISVEKIKSKITCLCYTSTQRWLRKKATNPKNTSYKNDEVCEKGICKAAMMNKKDDFTCKCIKKPKITECNNTSCDKTEFKTTITQTIPTSCDRCRGFCFLDIIKNKFKVCKKNVMSNEHINEMPQNAGDQTGEPLIELRVDSDDMSVLNPDEIKDKVIDLSKKYKGKPTCICPSHNKRREQFLAKNLCEGGICQRKFVDKKTNFNCKCEKGGECSDFTCNGKKKRRSKRTKCEYLPVKTEPMFEVQLDADRMYVLNSKEMNKNIIEIENEAKERADAVCPGGICGVARAENRNLFKCKCIEKKRKPTEITECSKETCDINDVTNTPEEVPTDLMYYWLSKLYNKINNTTSNKMIRKPLDLKELRKIKSMFSSVRDRIKSTSEIWTGSDNTSPTPPQPNMGLKLNVNKKHSETCTCNICDPKTRTSLGCKCKSFMSCSLSGLKKRHKNKVNKANLHKRNGLTLPPPQKRRHTQHTNKTVSVAQVTDLPETVQENTNEFIKKIDNTCVCSNICECAKVLEKEKEKEKLRRYKNKPKKKKRKKKKNNKKQLREEELKNKKFQSADNEFQKQLRKKEKLESKKRVKMIKQEQKEMKELSKQDEARDTNCLADFFIGLIKLGVVILKGILSVLYKIITDPEGSYRYTRQRLRDPKGTADRLRRWSGEAWQRQKFRMNRTIKGSRTMTILTDEIKETELYQAFSYKGKTNAERQLIEASHKRRQKRIRKRENEAIYGCRHMLLVTMRKTPCLWVYHICPTFYPQFLSARMFFINFSQMLLFCVAIVFWTPCIACCELFRGLMCCMLCTR